MISHWLRKAFRAKSTGCKRVSWEKTPVSEVTRKPARFHIQSFRKGRFDDYTITLRSKEGWNDIKLGEVDIHHSQEKSYQAIEKISADLSLLILSSKKDGDGPSKVKSVDDPGYSF